MCEIDRRLGEWDRLINSLSYRCELVPESEHPALFIEMADIAQQNLGDTSRSLSLLGRALDLSPSDPQLLDIFCERHVSDNLLRELVEDLKTRAENLEAPNECAEYYRRIARVLSEHVGNQEGAQEAWHEVLKCHEDVEALRFLRDRAERFGQIEVLADFTHRLSQVVEDPTERRDNIVEYALLLAEQLDRLEDACGTLIALVQEFEEPDLGVLDRLSDLLIQRGDFDSAREHLMLRLENTPSDTDPLPAAQSLADLARESLTDEALETFALVRWCDYHEHEERARHRLHELYLNDDRVEDATQTLDELIEIQGRNVGAQDLSLRAAKLEIEQLDDLERGWKRLTALVHANHPESEAYAFSVAESYRYETELATLLIDCARQSAADETQIRRWRQAAKLYEEKVQDLSRALESTLRALAIDLGSSEMLDEADRLFILAGAWPRAAQVYNKLVTSTQSATEQSRILYRHARLLDQHTDLHSDALDRALRGWELNPGGASDPRLEFLEKLAESSNRQSHLLPVYSALLASNLAADETLSVSLKRLRVSYLHVGLNRGHEHLHTLLQDCVDNQESLDAIEHTLTEVSESFGEPLRGDPVRQLVDEYLGMAEGRSEDEGSLLFARAAHLMSESLQDHETALDIWRAGTNLWPDDDDLMDEMEGFCEAHNLLDELAAHLEHIVSETVDSNIAARVLERWGRLLEVGMEDYERAVAIYRKLLNLTPDDPDITRRIRRCLEHQGRHQEVLGIIRHELDRATLPRERVQLLHEIAAIWEHDLENRWEALDAWKAVLAEDPEHPEAVEALRRLGHATRKITEEASTSASIETPLSEEDDEDLRRQDFSDVEESLTELDGVSSVLFSSDMLDETLDPATPDDLVMEESVDGYPPREIITAHTVVADDEEDSLAFHLAELTQEQQDPPVGEFEDEETATEAQTDLVGDESPEEEPLNPDAFATSASGVVDLGSDLVNLEDASLEEDIHEFEAETRNEMPVDAEAETELTQAD